jgi:hypothetical protein
MAGGTYLRFGIFLGHLLKIQPGGAAGFVVSLMPFDKVPSVPM